MKYRLMGKSGLRVSELALGAMTFGTQDWGVEKDESRRVFDGFREAGGNFVDTANVYSRRPQRDLPGRVPRRGARAHRARDQVHRRRRARAT